MSKAWFSPKQYGYGSGLPCSWEGWLVLLAYVVTVPLTSLLAFRLLPLPTAMAAWLGLTAVLTVAFLLVARAHTEGGWRWRNGSN